MVVGNSRARQAFVADLEVGAANLVTGCAGITSGQKVLVVAEDPALGWFDEIAPRAVAETARRLGAEVAIMPVGDPANAPPPGLAGAVADADVVIYFARIGDQDRFVDDGSGALRVVSYARTARALASVFGRRDHRKMLELKRRVDHAFQGVDDIEISCPLGTRLRGPGPAEVSKVPDVAVRRFPMCVPSPVSAQGFSGEVVLAEYLTPTGSRVYYPPWLALPEPVIAEVENGRIVGFRGAPAIVERVEAHYAAVAERFGILADAVHSWHAGIHDGCTFEGQPATDPDLWSNSVFGSPGYLHFHTCGDYPPGEICWMVAAPTIIADGRAIWREGTLTCQEILPPD
jgi:hypothetical protein